VIREQFANAIEGTVASLSTWTPRVIGGLVLLLLALLVAKLVERVLRAVLTRMKIGALAERLGVVETLKKVGIAQPLDVLIPRIVYYLLLFLFVQTAAEALGLGPISAAIGALFAYLPNVLSAVLIVLVGTVVAQMAGQTVARAARESGIDFASSLGSVVSGLIIFVLGIMAIAQLRIDTDIVRLVIACGLAGLALAFGLSFGLGTREITRNLIAGFYARKIFRTGDELEIQGERGVLRSITPTQTLLVQADNKVVAISNASFLDHVVRQ
jgi:small-conductance mechanosensitive channel